MTYGIPAARAYDSGRPSVCFAASHPHFPNTEFPMRRALTFSLLLALASSPVVAETQWTPFQLREVSGIRPFVDVRINQVPFSFMVHANAGFYAMTTHANAEQAGVGPLQSSGHYGITAPGQVSNQGVATTTVKTLQVGDDVVKDAPLKVFEAPQKQTMQGMLGMGWLRARRVLVDFDQHRIGIPHSSADTAQERQRLLAAGYVAHAMQWNAATNEYEVQVALNHASANFVVSTVANFYIDDHTAKRANVTLGKVVDTYGGPTGTTGKAYAAASALSLSIEGQAVKVPDNTRVLDLYDYEATPRPASPADQIGGFLGADVMLANHAVIDFGDGVLYLKP